MTKVKVEDVTAEWVGRKWVSDNSVFADMLNYSYDIAFMRGLIPLPPADPHPAGTAVRLAIEHFANFKEVLEVIEIDPPYPPTPPGVVN
jgi:hypothetical protein